jgi:hypothetical protein
MKVAISKPLTSVDGKTQLSKTETSGEGEKAVSVEFLDMDLEALTGADVEFCVREAGSAKGMVVAVLVTDLDFHIQVASKASGVAIADLRRLGARDFVEVATAVQSFLTGSV